MPAASHPVGTQHAKLSPPKANGTGTVEICGYGQVQIDKNDSIAIFQQVVALTKGAGTRWLSALQNSGDLRARVAGLLLEGKVTGGDSLHPVAEQTRNEVVQLAAGAGDPAVYAMALSMCGTSAVTDADSACRQLSLQGWARMDPDNAVPWLLLAGKARASHDSATEADAFSHAATAHRIDDPTSLPKSLVSKQPLRCLTSVSRVSTAQVMLCKTAQCDSNAIPWPNSWLPRAPIFWIWELERPSENARAGRVSA
jgi:hypothetical protein